MYRTKGMGSRERTLADAEDLYHRPHNKTYHMEVAPEEGAGREKELAVATAPYSLKAVVAVAQKA